ncbi:hypothetical protein E1A91_A03G159100v1 [Gossypium mustelinum]|uniref:Uncharacterized protein n=1 Tax=Gossypium mustelinum TaxID=34275 RepID=A0A5D3A088_GOSMU|nr:hypothetical protein E1A91_A03G159100v1 [Gossypium mustelinum]
MAHVSDIKLIRTDTTLDLSQKAEKVMWDEDTIIWDKSLPSISGLGILFWYFNYMGLMMRKRR